MKKTRKWYLLRVDVPMEHAAEITVKPEKLITTKQAIDILSMEAWQEYEKDFKESM